LQPTHIIVRAVLEVGSARADRSDNVDSAA
jgi:hypothetical protein